MTDILQHPLVSDPDFNEAFTDFLSMRKKIKKPATERAIKLLLKKVIELSGANKEKAIAIIDRSNVNCWQDLYQLPDTGYGLQTPIQKRREI